MDALPELIDPADGRLHTSFNQTGAATGRISSSNPNLQNIPIRTELGREIRAAFVPHEGWKLLVADYSQIELRLLAHMSEDELLTEAFRNGEDLSGRIEPYRTAFGCPRRGRRHELFHNRNIRFVAIAGQIGPMHIHHRAIWGLYQRHHGRVKSTLTVLIAIGQGWMVAQHGGQISERKGYATLTQIEDYWITCDKLTCLTPHAT